MEKNVRNGIECIPVCQVFHLCIECDAVRAFCECCNHCWVCGCDSPTGELGDETIPQEVWDAEYHEWVY